MSFLRRLLGGGAAESTDGTGDASAEPASGTPEDAERDYERELLREEARRLDDLQQRQLRYAGRAWTPPAQGGERRADDEDAAREE